MTCGMSMPCRDGVVSSILVTIIACCRSCGTNMNDPKQSVVRTTRSTPHIVDHQYAQQFD